MGKVLKVFVWLIVLLLLLGVAAVVILPQIIDPNDYNAQYYLKQVLEAQTERRIRWEEYDEARASLHDALTYMPGDSDLLRWLEDVNTAEKKGN